MIYTLTITCVSGRFRKEPFKRVVEVESSMTLNELHALIQSLAAFDGDHMYDFFAGKTIRDRKNTIGGHADHIQREQKFDNIRLADIFPLPKGKKLFYWFDFGDNWMFGVALKTQEEKGDSAEYPRIVGEKGPKPDQYPESEW